MAVYPNLYNFGPITVRMGSILLSNSIKNFTGTAAPTNGTSGTGANLAGPGSTYVQTNGAQYVNIGTKLSPTWMLIGGAVAREVKFCTTQTDATANVVLANVTGLTGFTLAAAGTYRYEANLATTAGASGGIKLAFKYTTATLTSLEATGLGFVAAASAAQHTTTATDQATLYAQTAAVLFVRITGRIVVNAAGTLALQVCQNVSDAATTSVFVGSSLFLERIS